MRHGPEADHVVGSRSRRDRRTGGRGRAARRGRAAGSEVGSGGVRSSSGRMKRQCAHDVARVAVVGLGVALRVAGELAAVGVVVAVDREVAAVAGQHRAALVGEDLQAVLRQLEVAHDLGAQQRRDVGAVRVGEARVERARDRGAADPVVLLDDERLQAGLGEIAGGDEAVVAGADDDGVVARSRPLLGFDLLERAVDRGLEGAQRVGEAGCVVRRAHEPAARASRARR